jgi:CubicO group peptidase (beta-lactamase class C family)
LLLVATLAGALACTVDRPGQRPSPPDVPLDAAGRSRVEALMAAARVPGLAAARVARGREPQVATFGVTDLRTGQPLTAETLCPAPILVDPLLAVATLRAAEHGWIALDDQVGDSTPFAILARAAAPLEPRRAIIAPASGAADLAAHLAAVAGSPLQTIFGPLGMTHTRIGGGPPPPAWATGHDLIGTPVAAEDDAAVVLTTITDLAGLVRELLAPQRLDRGAVVAMLTPRTALADRVAWGLGLGLEHDGVGWGFWLAGQQGGFTCLLAGSPARGLGAAVLTTSDNGLAIATELLTELMGGDHPAVDWLPVERWDSTAFLVRRRLVEAGVGAGAQELAATLADAELSYGVLELSEALLNRVGYDLLARGLPGAAVVVLRRNAELHPESWNVHDSLGEALAAAGDLAGAEASYRRSLERNPANANARRWLEGQ